MDKKQVSVMLLDLGLFCAFGAMCYFMGRMDGKLNS